MKKKTVAKKMALEMLDDFKNIIPTAGLDVVINEFVKMITAKFESEMSALPDGPEKSKRRRMFETMMSDELDGLRALIASEQSDLGDIIDKESGEIMSDVGEYYDGFGESSGCEGEDEIDEATAAEMTEKFKKASRQKIEDELFKPMMEDFRKTFLND